MRAHPAAFAVTMRRLGVSVAAIGSTVSWAEAYDLVVGALEDTSTPLFAAVSGWAFPASMPELVAMAGAASSPGAVEALMPWTIGAELERRAAMAVSPEEEAAALRELRAVLGR